MGGVACLRGDAKIRIACPVFRRRKTFFDHISRLFKMYECIHRSKWSSERSASIEYGYMKQFFEILPLDVKIGSDTTYYHFNCGPLYIGEVHKGINPMKFSCHLVNIVKVKWNHLIVELVELGLSQENTVISETMTGENKNTPIKTLDIFFWSVNSRLTSGKHLFWRRNLMSTSLFLHFP